MGKPAARTMDKVAHPVPGTLMPGPGSMNVITGGKPSWRGLPAAAAAALQAAKAISDAVVQTAEKATVLAAGTPGAPAAIAAEKAAKAAATTALGSLMNSLGAASAALGGIPDLHMCLTPPLPPPPHGPGMVIDGSPTVLVNGLPFCAVGDHVLEALGPPDEIVMGCQSVLVGKAGGGGGGIGAAIAAALAAMGNAAAQYLKDFAAFVDQLAAAAIAAEQAAAAAIKAFVDQLKAAMAAEKKRQDLLQKIKDGKSSIKIEGDDAYKKKVMDNLDTLSKSPTGMGLLQDLDANKHTTTIKDTGGANIGNSEDASDPAKRADGVYDKANDKPGPGTDTVVNFSPDRHDINSPPPAPQEDWKKRDPAVGLGHELIHADHDVNGTTDGLSSDPNVDYTDQNGDARSAPGYELQAAGLGPHADDPYTENKIRKDFQDQGLGENGGEKQRPRY